MEVIRFKKGGPALVAEVACGYAQEGAYALYLWEVETNAVLEKWRGNFLNTEDDAYALPKPNGKHHGRLLECLTTIVVTPPIQKYAVSLTVTQGGKKLGRVSASGETDQPALTVDLFAKLEAE